MITEKEEKRITKVWEQYQGTCLDSNTVKEDLLFLHEKMSEAVECSIFFFGTCDSMTWRLMSDIFLIENCMTGYEIERTTFTISKDRVEPGFFQSLWRGEQSKFVNDSVRTYRRGLVTKLTLLMKIYRSIYPNDSAMYALRRSIQLLWL